MADFIYVREDKPESVYVVLRVPRRLWLKWESRHAHFGKAISALRITVEEIMAVRTMHADYRDGGDPFWRGEP